MPFFAASKIHDGNKWLPDNTVIQTDDEGMILALHQGEVTGAVQQFDGVLCPGFVNAHCHLELSHLKRMVKEHTGLIPFLQAIPRHRNDFTDEQKREARHSAFEELRSNGTVAVGDIANTADTNDLRDLHQMHFHSFAEAIGFSEHNALQSFNRSLQLLHLFENCAQGAKILRQSITPHAPYSVSHGLFTLIHKHDKQALLSIHNQESKAEDEYYTIKKGPVNLLLHGFGIDDSFFEASGKSSLQTYLPWLHHTHPLILVHNTFSHSTDIAVALASIPQLYWCLCPNANLYIEQTLPDVMAMVHAGLSICVGTDSLASNHKLSVLGELQTLHAHFPEIAWDTLLQWGTLNGAKALQMDSQIGSIAVGKKPGLLHIKDLTAQKPEIEVIYS
jgi:aminodeoxyfutalosine deaminase